MNQRHLLIPGLRIRRASRDEIEELLLGGSSQGFVELVEGCQ